MDTIKSLSLRKRERLEQINGLGEMRTGSIWARNTWKLKSRTAQSFGLGHSFFRKL